MLEQHKDDVTRVSKRGSKDRNETLPSFYGISLNESGRQCEFAAEVFTEERGK